MITTSLLHLVFILVDDSNGIFNKIYSNDLVLYISLGLILISIFLLKCLENKLLIVFPSFIGVLGLFYLFYFSKPGSAPFYVNPFSIILIYICFPCFLFVSSFLFRQTRLVLLGLTTKEFESILLFQKEMATQDLEKSSGNSDNYKKGEIYSNIIKSLSCMKKLKNFVEFFKKEIPGSLVLILN